MERQPIRLAAVRRDAMSSVTLVARSVAVAGFVAASALPALAQQQIGPKVQHKEPEKAPTRTGPAEQQFPFGATWILSQIGGRPVSGDAPSFTLDSQLRAVGFGGCNTFSMALYPIREQKLAAGSIAMTHTTCDKGIADTEKEMLVTLHSMPKWHLEANGDLTLTGASNANGTANMTFKRGL